MGPTVPPCEPCPPYLVSSSTKCPHGSRAITPDGSKRGAKKRAKRECKKAAKHLKYEFKNKAATKKTKGCKCTKDWHPVCGSNGKTYINDCTAKCAEAEPVSEGKCPRQKKRCHLVGEQVYFDKGRVDKAVCKKSGSLLETASALGTGADPARTTNKYGGNGGYGAWATSTTKEKDDEEEANKEKDEEETKENEGCICPEVYQPVCGSNDKTYSNNCTAVCEKSGSLLETASALGTGADPARTTNKY